MRRKIIEALPPPLANSMRLVKHSVEAALEWPDASFHSWRRDSIKKITALKDTHKGERCIIIGNGPSLKNTDLSKLKGSFTVGMNRFYMAFPDLGFSTSCLLTVNDLVIEQCAQDLRSLSIPTFVSWRGRKWIDPSQNLHYLHTSYNLPRFNGNAAGRLWEGATVTFVAMQLAYYLGFKQVVLIGVDHSFSTKGTPNTTITSTGDDPNHFHAGYFGKGFRWQLPDLETSEIAYTMAKEAYRRDGREILDATVDGKLIVFPKIAYESLF
jgi:hypothetical protein